MNECEGAHKNEWKRNPRTHPAYSSRSDLVTFCMHPWWNFLERMGQCSAMPASIPTDMHTQLLRAGTRVGAGLGLGVAEGGGVGTGDGTCALHMNAKWTLFPEGLTPPAFPSTASHKSRTPSLPGSPLRSMGSCSHAGVTSKVSTAHFG